MKKAISILVIISICMIGVFLFLRNDSQHESIDSMVVADEFVILTAKKGDENGQKNTIQTVQKLCDITTEELAGLESEVHDIVYTFIPEFKNLGLTKGQQENIVQSASFSVDKFRRMTAWHNQTEYTNLMTVKGRPIPLEPKLYTNYYSYLYSKNYEGIISLAKSKLFISQNIANGNSILSNTILHDTAIPFSVVEQLLNAGLAPNFVELVKLTKANLPLDIINLVAGYATDDINQFWYEQYRENTLTMLAASKFNYELFEYWFNLGVPATGGEFDFSAMDMIATPTNGEEIKQATKIFKLLADNNVNPYDQRTLSKIKKWLSLDIQQNYHPYFLNNAEIKITGAEFEISKKLASAIGYKNKVLDSANIRKLKCDKEREALSETFVENSDKSLAGSPLIKELTSDFVLKLSQAKNSGNWENYLLDTDEMVEQTGLGEMYNIALMMAIQSNSPISVIDDLLERGATIPENAIFTLAMNSNLELTKKLIPRGLNIHYKSQQQRNALYYASTLNASIEMFDFLLNNGVSVTKAGDLLDVLLAKQISNTAYYSKQLVARGYQITKKHKNAYEKLKVTNIQLHESLKDIFGEE